MVRKVSVFILLSTFCTISAAAQDAPKPDEDRTLNRVLSMAFGGGSYLGVEISDVNQSNYAEFGLSEVRGVHVSKVLENSPADKAGLKAGDVIVEFDGQSVTSTRKLTRLISEVAPDHTVDVRVVRGGSEISLNATIGKREMPGMSSGTFVIPAPPRAPRPPKAPGAPAPPDAPDAPELFEFNIPDIQIMPPDGEGRSFVWSTGSRRTIGIGVSSLSEQLGDYFGVDGGNGILVTSVSKDSPAERAGLKAGDVITAIDGNKVNDSMDIVRALNAEKEGDVILTVVRNKKERTVTVTPEASKAGEFLFQGGGPEALRGLMTEPRVRIAPRPDRPGRPMVVTPGTRVL